MRRIRIRIEWLSIGGQSVVGYPQGLPLHGLKPVVGQPQGLPLHGLNLTACEGQSVIGQPQGLPLHGLKPVVGQPQGLPLHGLKPVVGQPQRVAPTRIKSDRLWGTTPLIRGKCVSLIITYNH